MLLFLIYGFVFVVYCGFEIVGLWAYVCPLWTLCFSGFLGFGGVLVFPYCWVLISVFCELPGL